MKCNKCELFYALDFNKPHVGYEDNKKRDVCGCCGTYYVVSPGELDYIQGTVEDMYEALKGLLRDYSTNPNTDVFYKACKKARAVLAKVEGANQ